MADPGGALLHPLDRSEQPPHGQVQQQQHRQSDDTENQRCVGRRACLTDSRRGKYNEVVALRQLHKYMLFVAGKFDQFEPAGPGLDLVAAGFTQFKQTQWAERQAIQLREVGIGTPVLIGSDDTNVDRDLRDDLHRPIDVWRCTDIFQHVLGMQGNVRADDLPEPVGVGEHLHGVPGTVTVSKRRDNKDRQQLR